MHTTYNTSECCKYEIDGTLQKSFSRKAVVGQKRHGSSKTSNSFVQIMERFLKLETEKTVKKNMKSARKKKRRQEDSNSSDSDLE